MKKNIIIVFSLLFFVVGSAAQTEKDTMRYVENVIYAKFPTTRFIDFQYQQYSSADYKLRDQESELLEKGDVRRQKRVSLALNYPIIYKKVIISPQFRYNYDKFEFKNLESFGALAPRGESDFHSLSGGVNISHVSTLFGKPIFYSGSFMLLGTERAVQSFNAYVMGMMILKRDKATKITLGLMYMYSPSVNVPVFPLFGLEHNFEDTWSLDVALPRYSYIRKNLTAQSRLSAGLLFDSESFFTHSDNSNYPKNALYRNAKIKMEGVYEYLIARKIVLSASLGVAKVIDSKLTKKNSEKKIIKGSQDMNSYFNVGISFAPFK